MIRRCSLALLFALTLAPAYAQQEVVIYRCTDAQGALSVQNMPCPKGTQQQKKIMQAPAPTARPATPTQPAPVAPPPPAPATSDKPAQRKANAEPTTAVPAAPKPPPPALYDCKRRDDTRYLTEDLQSATYCMPLQVTGLDGNPRTGAGDACEVVSDRCQPVADDGLCAAWRKQVEDAETHWRFATPDHAAQRQAEYARVRDLLAASNCGDGAQAQKP